MKNKDVQKNREIMKAKGALERANTWYQHIKGLADSRDQAPNFDGPLELEKAKERIDHAKRRLNFVKNRWPDQPNRAEEIRKTIAKIDAKKFDPDLVDLRAGYVRQLEKLEG